MIGYNSAYSLNKAENFEEFIQPASGICARYPTRHRFSLFVPPLASDKIYWNKTRLVKYFYNCKVNLVVDWYKFFDAMLMIFIDIQDDKMLHMSFRSFECQCDKVRKFHNLLHKLSLWAKVSTKRLIQTSLRLSLCLSIAIREKLLSQLLNVSLGTIIGFLYRIVYWIDSKICWIAYLLAPRTNQDAFKVVQSWPFFIKLHAYEFL